MPPKRRVQAVVATPSKRSRGVPRGTLSQPISIESPPSSSRLSPRQALVEASQVSSFEARLRETQAQEAIIPSADGSEEATIASNELASIGFDEHLVDAFEGLDWDHFPQYMKPLASQRGKKSWIYLYGYRVASWLNPRRHYFICRFCYKQKFIDAGICCIYGTTRSTSAARRHLEEDKPGHGYKTPEKVDAEVLNTIQAVLTGNRVSQAVANELSGFNIQRFRLAAVAWIVETNQPLSTFESPAFRDLIASANPQAEKALWTSHNSVSSYIIRLYDYLKPRVITALSQAQSKIHISFDGWTTKSGKRGFLGIVAHYVDSQGNIVDLPIALPQLTGAHTGERIAEIVLETLRQFNVDSDCIGYFVLDNARNNDAAVDAIARMVGFDASHRRLRCGPHTINLIDQTLLWGRDYNTYNNSASELTTEDDYMGEWKRDGPLGVLMAIVNHIKTPRQYELFESFQRRAHDELPADAPAHNRKILEPVKPIVTRWNSYYACFERAVQLQAAINAYANHHINETRKADSWASSRGNQLPIVPRWMRSDGLTTHDWAVVTEYIDVLRPLKSATKRLEGRDKSGRFGAIAEVIPVFEYVLNYYEQRVQAYDAVDYNAHDEAPEDHLAINTRAAWAKANDYYDKQDLSPAYYAATILHPCYKTYCDLSWSADNPDWLTTNNHGFRALWATYNTALATTPAITQRPKSFSTDMDDAIDALLNTATASNDAVVDDEFDRWKQCEPRVERGTEYANNPTRYWILMRDRYPRLSRLALDVLSIPASSCECERMFSELGDLLEPRRRGMQPQLLAAIQCVRRWRKAGLGNDDISSKVTITDDSIETLYEPSKWDSDINSDGETQHQE
ncbi:Dimerhypothetical proteinTnphypothetical proteinhAT domainhypothetical proteincontaining protein [Bipolaris maydis]|nr:Dimerhypothetical proteinTnphypothetical proteinhAT domainhypothetical proteincontaining protein [Bipolaris maydis]